MIVGMRSTAALTAFVGGMLVLAACGSQQAGSSDGDVTPTADPPAGMVPDDYAGRYRATLTVLSSPAHGPQLCSFVMESYPPQCEGPDVAGWDWAVVQHESALGTSWGTYDVVGTFDDNVFTLTEPPIHRRSNAPTAPDERKPVSPCPEPADGWPIPDASKARQEDMARIGSAARTVDGYAGVWIGWLIPDAEITERSSADPDNFVVNVLTTGDIAATERAVRDVWGGKLCVASAHHTERELRQIADQVVDTPGMTSVGTDEIRGKVTIGVWVAYEALWQRLAAEHGAGVIELAGLLRPIDRHK